MAAVYGNNNESFIISHFPNVIESIKKNIKHIGNRQPKIGRDDYTWDFCGEWDWVSSFWVGQLWLSYQVTAEPIFKEAAQLQKYYFKKTLSLTKKHNHDLGFVFSLSCVAQYKLTGDEEAKQLAISAADCLVSRYRPNGKYIVAWNSDTPHAPENVAGKVIIDSFQNMALLYWASDVTGNDKYAECATNHTNTLIKHIVRDDYSVHQTFNFDPLTGEPIGGENYQGYSDDSCWSRGVAWAIHGLAQIYQYTKDAHHLETAMQIANRVVGRLQERPVPLWDYKLPIYEKQTIDTSAASCTAAGLLMLHDLCEDETLCQIYKSTAEQVMCELIDKYDLTSNHVAQGLLSHGASVPGWGKHNNMLPYGDYYYVEAFMRLQGYKQFAW